MKKEIQYLHGKIGVLLIAIVANVVQLAAQPFMHPGILHSSEDLLRMKTAVALQQQPVYQGYQVFIKDPASQYTYKMQGPLKTVGRNPGVGSAVYDNDANAAHQNAVMWAITGDKRYAQKSIEIINAWAAALTAVTGRDAVLMAGLGPFKMINAAEIIRYTGAGWKAADIRKAEKHFKEVIYPVLKDYAPFANGNWDAAALKTCMAIGVFCNDRPVFEAALRYYTQGWGNGSISNYIINASGQIQESGRDQPHSQLGIGMLAECCAIAWNQGLDLYGYNDNRLLKGFEYTARYNLGNDDLPFSEWLDRTGKYHHYRISDKGRGQLRPLYEQVYAHYIGLKKLSAPDVARVVEKIRPEGPGRPGADHPGYGTLYYGAVGVQNPVAAKETPPAGLVAQGFNTEVRLSWIAPNAGNDRITYNVKRAEQPSGPFKVIAENSGTASFTDKTVKQGRQYYYTVAAVYKNGSSRDAFVQPAVAGLPGRWMQKEIGNITPGLTFFDGSRFKIEAFGRGPGKTADSFHYTFFPVQENATLECRIDPQPGSQFSIMGLMLRKDLTEQSPFVSLLLYPGKTENVEEPAWHTELEVRMAKNDAKMSIANGNGLTEPAVTFGRLTGYYWLRLQKRGNLVTASVSGDGRLWQEAGSFRTAPEESRFLGIAVASGMIRSTVVRIDQVRVNGRTPSVQ
ncbi:alginate lyase family protein [Niabella hirudinis]|uniref:alginate lyase family protein n=1 Tax=Niabella hirudinis TaxID=1285929 RepID=UPI003EBF601C